MLRSSSSTPAASSARRAKNRSDRCANWPRASRRKQTLIAAGCLSQIWGPQIVAEVPGIDGVIGTRRWMDIVEFTEKLRATKHPEPLYHLPEEAKVVGADEHGALRVSVDGRQRVSQNCRWVPAALRLLLHSAHQGHGGQPSAGSDRARSARAGRARRARVDPDRARPHRLRPRSRPERWPAHAARIDLRQRAGIEVDSLDVSISRRGERSA